MYYSSTLSLDLAVCPYGEELVKYYNGPPCNGPERFFGVIFDLIFPRRCSESRSWHAHGSVFIQANALNTCRIEIRCIVVTRGLALHHLGGRGVKKLRRLSQRFAGTREDCQPLGVRIPKKCWG